MKQPNKVHLDINNKGVKNFLDHLNISSQDHLNEIRKSMLENESNSIQGEKLQKKEIGDFSYYDNLLDACSFTLARYQIMQELEQANPFETTAQATKRNTRLATLYILYLSMFEGEDCPEGLVYKRANEIYNEQLQILSQMEAEQCMLLQ
jgi:hypothetical protein